MPEKPPLQGLLPTAAQTEFILAAWQTIERTPLMAAGAGAGKSTALRMLAQMLEEVADASPTSFPTMEDRLTYAGQAAGPDEYPEGYYRHLATERLDGTLPQWIAWRFGHVDTMTEERWLALPDADRAYWAHESRAVRRAVARGGFKKES